MAQRNFVPWRYTDKNDVVYVRRADSRMTTQQGDNAPVGAVGGSSGNGLAPYEEMPRNLKPRRVLCKEAGTSFAGSVVIYDQATWDAITAGTTTFVIYDAGGTGHTCVVYDKVGEGARGVIKPV